jgi:hypothetical protein
MCQIVHPCDKLLTGVTRQNSTVYSLSLQRTHSICRWTPNSWSVLIHSFIRVCSSGWLLTSRQNNITQRVTIKYDAKFEFLTFLFMNIQYFTTLKNVSICKQLHFGSAGRDRCILCLKEIRLTTNKAPIPKNFKFSFSCIHEKYSKPEILLIFSRYTIT